MNPVRMASCVMMLVFPAIADAGPGSTAGATHFSKLSNAGDVLPTDAALGTGVGDWICTRDNLTGLVWEVKRDDAAHRRHMAHRYKWFERELARNGRAPGLFAADHCAGVGRCDTERFVAEVNAEGMCGARDWRLPTVRELETIVDFSRVGPAVDPEYFPNTPDSYYWSATPYSGDRSVAWYVSFNHGSASHGFRDFALHVRLVRGGAWITADAAVSGDVASNCNAAMVAATPSGEFLDHGDGTVTDRRTGLRWQRCAEGQRWVRDTCAGVATLHSWSAAMAMGCTTTGGAEPCRDGWRLPELLELRSIVEERCHSPAINDWIFPNTPAVHFWSATPFVAYPGDAWTVDFAMGNSGYHGGASVHAVRLVRDGRRDVRSPSYLR
jgi:hypothetical protein